MKKIYFSLIAIFLVVVFVSVTAYSLFFSTASISGVTFSTGSASLLVGDGTSFQTNWSPGTFLFENMVPGGSAIVKDFSLKNTSASDIAMNLSAKLNSSYTESPVGAWDALKTMILVRITSGVGSTNSWHTLDDFKTTGISFDTGLAKNTSRDYHFEVKLSDSADNTASGKGLSSVTIDFTGEQN